MSPEIQALLCPCDECFERQIAAAEARAIRDQRNRHLHPLCPFCLSPMLWREVAFVCPYGESQEVHEEIRRLNTPILRVRSRVAATTPVEGGWLLQ